MCDWRVRVIDFVFRGFRVFGELRESVIIVEIVFCIGVFIYRGRML